MALLGMVCSSCLSLVTTASRTNTGDHMEDGKTEYRRCAKSDRGHMMRTVERALQPFRHSLVGMKFTALWFYRCSRDYNRADSSPRTGCNLARVFRFGVPFDSSPVRTSIHNRSPPSRARASGDHRFNRQPPAMSIVNVPPSPSPAVTVPLNARCRSRTSRCTTTRPNSAMNIALTSPLNVSSRSAKARPLCSEF